MKLAPSLWLHSFFYCTFHCVAAILFSFLLAPLLFFSPVSTMLRQGRSKKPAL